MDITAEIAVELLRAASFYCVLELQKRAEEFLSHEICVENVVDLLSVADECNAQDLKKNCVPFLLRHIHDVVQLPAFQEHRIQASEEVLKALSGVLGPEWEASYKKFVANDDGSMKPQDSCDEMPAVMAPPASLPRAVPEYLLAPEFLLSPVPPPSGNGYQPAFATVDSPVQFNGGGNRHDDDSTTNNGVGASLPPPLDDTPSFLKTFRSQDVAFTRPYGFSEDLSEGISEGVC